jgi:hypothetical protein
MSQPLIKPICGDKAPALFEGSLEGGFRGYCFHAGIDHPGTDGDILGPDGHQSPVAFFDVPVVLVLDDYWNLLSRSHIMVRLDLKGGRLSIEEPLKLSG